MTVCRDSLKGFFFVTNISNQNENRPGKGTKSANCLSYQITLFARELKDEIYFTLFCSNFV